MRASITFSSPRGPPPKPHVRPTSLYASGGGTHIPQTHPPEPAPLGFREVFARTSFKDRNLFACSQARLVNNLNDGMRWDVFPLFFATFGIGVEIKARVCGWLLFYFGDWHGVVPLLEGHFPVRGGQADSLAAKR